MNFFLQIEFLMKRIERYMCQVRGFYIMRYDAFVCFDRVYFMKNRMTNVWYPRYGETRDIRARV